MVAALNWEIANGTSITLEASGAALTDNTIVLANDVNYIGSTTLDTWGWLELVGTFGTAPDDTNPSVDVYIAMKSDGTTFASAPVTGGVDCGDQYLISIPIRKIATAQRKVSMMFKLPPHDTQFYIDNQTGQSLNSTWALKLVTNSLESQ
jgi:hypothetical protein